MRRLASRDSLPRAKPPAEQLITFLSSLPATARKMCRSAGRDGRPREQPPAEPAPLPAEAQLLGAELRGLAVQALRDHHLPGADAATLIRQAPCAAIQKRDAKPMSCGETLRVLDRPVWARTVVIPRSCSPAYIAVRPPHRQPSPSQGRDDTPSA